MENLSLMKKFVKPKRKYLRNIQRSVCYPELQKLLRFPTDLEVRLTKESLRILSLHSNVKKLSFEIASNFSKEMNEEELLMKYKASLSRSFASMKGLKNMSMMIMDSEAESTILLLETIDLNLSLDSLEHCGLRFVSGLFTKNFQKFPEQKASLSKILAKVTSLDSESPVWYAFLISSGKFDNLSALNLKLASNEIYWDSKDLLQSHNLPKLKNFSLDFKVDSLSSERNFFENFSLPSSLESLNLILSGFTLSPINDDEALSHQFFKRLQEAKGVRTLNLDVIKNTTNLALTAKFYCLFLSCFDNLETLECKHSKERPLFKKDETEFEAKPLDFQDFWTAITPSKETLQSISVYVTGIFFPEDISHLETGFPRLQKLHLRGSLLSANELGRFCQKIPSLTDVVLREVKFTDVEGLRIFLDDMKEIPKGRKFELYLNVGSIRSEPLIDCLKKYIEDAKVKGRLGIYLYGILVKDRERFLEILKMAKDKGCFQPFEIMMKYF